MKASCIPTNHFIHAQWSVISNYEQAVLPEHRVLHVLPEFGLAC